MNGRWQVYRWRPGYWAALGPHCVRWPGKAGVVTHTSRCQCTDFPTWHEAMSYADREARR